MVIHKTELSIRLTNPALVRMPVGSKVISCGFQNDRLMMWFVTETNVAWEFRKYHVIRTGEEYQGINLLNFIGTAGDYSDPSFPFVVHVFEGDLPTSPAAS